MVNAVAQTMTELCEVVRAMPANTNLAPLRLLWMMLSGHFLSNMAPPLQVCTKNVSLSPTRTWR